MSVDPALSAAAAAVVLVLRVGGTFHVWRIGSKVRVLTCLTASSNAGAATVESCKSTVRHDVIRVWARAGFTGPKPRVPYVLGRSGQIAAILFGYPLRNPPEDGRNNKILWVSHTAAKAPAALWIRAVPMVGTRTMGAPVRRVIVGGPGPSIVDLPSAGCWRVTLTWSGRKDSLDLEYS